MTSYRDPDYQAQSFSRILVYANITDLGWRGQIEGTIVDALTVAKVSAIGSMAVLPPTRDLTGQEIDSSLAAHFIDGFLLVTVTGTGAESVHIPAYSRTVTEGTARSYAGTTHTSETSHTTTSGGYDASKPWANFSSDLYDARTGQKAWMATSVSSGNAYASMSTVVNSYCGEVVCRLVNEGMTRRTLEEPRPKAAPESPFEPLPEATYTIVMTNGKKVGADVLRPSSSGMLKYRRTGGKDEYVASASVRAIVGRTGHDVTREVLDKLKSKP